MSLNTHQTIFQKLKTRSHQLRSEPVAKRIERLRKLEAWVRKNEPALAEAVYKDMGKPPMEVATSEIFPALSEISHAIDNLARWTKPTKIDAPITFLGTRSEVIYEPKGVCLIIAPWNYPFNLCIGPLASCLAAGNAALLKPSELTPNTSAFIAKLVAEVFDNDVVAVVEGDADVATTLLQLPFDHIFFTGSPAVGKIIMKAAAERLASVTLELGGKSPAVIDTTANLKDAAKRIAFGKFVNAGQTCIAPDYVLVDKTVEEKFISLLKENIAHQFHNYSGRVINERHSGRLKILLDDAIKKGAVEVLSGERTVLTNVTNEMLVMQEEIFGPILPVMAIDLAQAVDFINSKPKPLALYVFSNSAGFKNNILKNTSAGGVCINDCVLQFVHPNLPFGGVNNSGIGKAHGHAGFLAFTNEKPVVRQKRGYSMAYLFYPPYTSFKRKILDIVLRWFV
jgi:aldehyde dehydrogenase (NAD+)